jgi:hypothetical protein
MTFPFASLTAWLALAAYAGLSWHFLAHAHGWSIPWRRALNIEHLLVAAALALHFLALLPANAHGLAFGLGQSLSTVMWLTVLIYWTASFFYKLDGLQTCLMPMAVLGVALAQLLPPAYLAYDFHQPALLLHIAVSLLAYSLLLIAAILAVMMLVKIIGQIGRRQQLRQRHAQHRHRHQAGLQAVELVKKAGSPVNQHGEPHHRGQALAQAKRQAMGVGGQQRQKMQRQRGGHQQVFDIERAPPGNAPAMGVSQEMPGQAGVGGQRQPGGQGGERKCHGSRVCQAQRAQSPRLL